jgi:uncharacterized membrane protein YbhN (UPF0104 family)
MTDPQPEQHRVSHAFNVAMLVFGAGALTWTLRALGWDELRAVVTGVGSRFAVILGLDLAAVLLDARALHAFMRPEARMVSYWRVVAAQISGRAVNVVTPFSALGEATKLTMLVSHAPRVRALSAIVLFNLAALYFSVTVMVIGVPITLLLVDLPRALQVTVAIGLAVAIALVIAVGLLIERGTTATLTAVLHRVRLISRARRDDWQTRLQELDGHLAELHDNRRAGTWRGVLWLIASRLVTWCSTMTLISAVGVAITPRLVFGVLSVGVLIAWIATVVPFGLGVADGGNYALYDLLGASGIHGAFVTMLNRVRSLAVAAVGFAVMAVVHTLNRLALARMRARLRDHRAQLRAP